MSLENKKSHMTKLDDLLHPSLVASLERLDLMSRKMLQGRMQGERRSRRRGQGMDFADFRPYAAGDDLRFVDWNIYGRLDRLFLKMFLEEEDLGLVIAIDGSASMDSGTPNKFDVARRIAMALGYVGLVNQHRVTLALLQEGRANCLSALRGRRRTAEAASWLIEQKAAGTSGFDSACRALASARLGRGMVIVISDYLLREGYESGLSALAARGWDVFALQILSPEEMDPRQGDQSLDVRLIDSENKSEVEITLSNTVVREQKRRLESFNATLRATCLKLGVRQMTIDSSVDYQKFLLESLRKQGLLK
ncbi:MAG: DUF58 domain-containing protein [Phycisphaerales bacterium]|nr:DUF58 domain-containing protein [Phycisphaerales bacterium]